MNVSMTTDVVVTVTMITILVTKVISKRIGNHILYASLHECQWQVVTMASWRPMLPMVTPPEKKMQGSQERTYRKSGDVYLRTTHNMPFSNYSYRLFTDIGPHFLKGNYSNIHYLKVTRIRFIETMRKFSLNLHARLALATVT